MKEVFEKIFEKLKDAGGCDASCEYDKGWDSAIEEAISIVHRVAEEYNNGWISCSERLPEERETVLLQDFDGFYELGVCTVKNNIKGFVDGDWWSSANNFIAWQPLPEPYRPEGDET